MKRMNAVRKFGRKVGTAVVAGSVIGAGVVGQAYADAADAISKIEGADTTSSDIGYAALGLLVVAATFKYMRRAV